MYINSVHDDVHNMKNAESCPLRHSQELKLTEKEIKINDTNTIRLMRFACWIIMFADTNSDYVTDIACPLQKWLY